MKNREKTSLNILLSIKPRFVELIHSGKKQWEFRRVLPSRDIDIVFMYASSPVRKIVGCFLYTSVDVAPPTILWARCGATAGISYKEFKCYFSGASLANAILISDPRWCKNPMDPRKVWPEFIVPQSFRYLNKEFPNDTELCSMV